MKSSLKFILIQLLLLVWLTSIPPTAIGREPEKGAAVGKEVWIPEVQIYFMPLIAESPSRVKPSSILAGTLPTSGDQRLVSESKICDCGALVAAVVGSFKDLPRKTKEVEIDTRAVFAFTRADGLRVFLAMDAYGKWEWANIELPLPAKKQLDILRKLLPAYELDAVSAKKDK